MGVALALVVAAAAIAFAVWPLLRRSGAAEAEALELSDLTNQRDMAIEDLRELDFDRALGNLSDEDHQALREQSKRRAVGILKQLQAHEGRIDEEIEQAVAALRNGSGSKR